MDSTPSMSQLTHRFGYMVVPLADGLVAPEGLRFAAGAEFPLYVAEEDTGTGSGRLSRVEADGSTTALCTGFANIEDVAVGPDKRLYISEDTTGRIISDEIPDENPQFIWLPVILRS